MKLSDADDGFDRFADRVAEFVAHAGFFIFSVVSVLVWVPTFWWFESSEAWQLPMNTYTTIVTFLLVALLHNNQHRFERATNARLHDLAERIGDGDPVNDEGQKPS